MTLGITSPLLAAIPNVSHRFFGRTGGTSPHPWNALNTSYDVDDSPARVDENLARIRFQLGVGKDALFSCKQVHGNAVFVVDAASDVVGARAVAADALVCGVTGFGVGVRTADCAPVLIAAKDGSKVAAVHAGWRGAVSGVIEAAVREFEGVDVVAAVGPCIGLDAFEVGPEVVAAAAAVVDVAGFVRDGVGDRKHLDLARLCQAVLHKAGVNDVDVVGGCTVSQPGLYFSHRRDHGHTGRQLSAIACCAPPVIDAETFR